MSSISKYSPSGSVNDDRDRVEKSQSSQSFAFSLARARSFARRFASTDAATESTRSIPRARARTVSKHPRQRRVMHANQLEPFRFAFALRSFAVPVPNPSQRASIVCASSVQMRDEIDHRVRSVVIRRKHRRARATSVVSARPFVPSSAYRGRGRSLRQRQRQRRRRERALVDTKVKRRRRKHRTLVIHTPVRVHFFMSMIK